MLNAVLTGAMFQCLFFFIIVCAYHLTPTLQWGMGYHLTPTLQMSVKMPSSTLSWQVMELLSDTTNGSRTTATW